MTGSVRQRTDMACHWLQDAFMATGEITTGPTKHSQACTRRTTMNIRQSLFATLAAALVMSAAGCAVTRGQESVGAYVDDTAITTALKGRYLDNKDVDATSIRVETLNGTVMLSGFAKNYNEKATAESIAWKINGVKSVKNEIAVRP